MRKLTYKNSLGESIELNLSPFLIDLITGLGGVDVDLQSQEAPYQDGDTHIDSKLQPRFITVEGTIIETTEEAIWQKRRVLTKVFNPKLGLGILTFENSVGKYEIGALLDGGVNFPEKGESILPNFDLTFKCPDPYWRSPEINTDSLAAFVPLFEFPFEEEFEVGMEGHETVVKNDSDTLLPINIKIKGPTVNPKLMNLATGEFIRVKRELLENDVLIINTQTKEILLNGENVFHYIDVNSVFFQLIYGENTLKYTADSGTETATLDIQTQQRYNAI